MEPTYRHRLQPPEYGFLAISTVGTIAAAVTQQVVYATVPLTLAMSLVLTKRQQFPQQTQQQTIEESADVRQVKQDINIIRQELNTLSSKFNTRPESQQIDSLKEVIAQLPSQISVQVWQTRQEVSGSLSQVEHQLATTQSEMVALREQLKQLQSQPSGGTVSPKPESDVGSKPSFISSKDGIVPKVEPRREEVQKATAWLAAQQVNINSYRQPNPDVDTIFNNLAVYLGERYSSLGDLHTQIKKSITTQSHFGFNLLNRSQQDILKCTQFCSKLNDYSLLSMYNYSKSKKLIQGALQRRGDVTKFLNGEWFERFVYHQISKLLSSQRLNYECMMNPILTFPNGDHFELDLFFMIKGHPLWIECKTGNNYNTCLERYSTHRKILEVPKERAILVILDISKEQTKNLTSLWDITVANTDNFVQVIENAINSFKSQENQQNMPSNKFNCTDNNLSKIFSKLRPVPEYRTIVINELLRVFEEIHQPMTQEQLEEILLKRLAEKIKISKGKLHEILLAIKQSNCLLNKNGEPVTSFRTPVSSLLSSDPAILEIKCVENYAIKVLRHDPNYFDNLQNVQHFEQTVGGKAPDSKTIEQLKNNLQNLLAESVGDLNIDYKAA